MIGAVNVWLVRHRRRLVQSVVLLAGLWAAVLDYNLTKPLPSGLSVAGPLRDASGMELIYDLTYQVEGREVVEQEIFDRVFAMIDEAEGFVVLDMFLFNGLHGGERDYRPLSEELTQHLRARMAARPDLHAVFITDEINSFYGAYTSPEMEAMQDAGIQVVTTRMMRLRDSNPAYSAGWRIFMGWFGTGGPGWLPNLFGRIGTPRTLPGPEAIVGM